MDCACKPFLFVPLTSFSTFTYHLTPPLHTSLLCDPWTARMTLIISSRYRMFNDLRSRFFWRLPCIHKYYSSNQTWNGDLNILYGYIYMYLAKILWDLLTDDFAIQHIRFFWQTKETCVVMYLISLSTFRKS